MKLNKQLIVAFSLVALVPLLLITIFLFGTNMRLAFDLYRQNLQNTVDIQANLLEENLNRMMVRASRFTNSPSVQAACRTMTEGGAIDPQLSSEILNFTDETLDNVSIFTLINQEGEVVYSSGSNSDTRALSAALTDLRWPAVQQVQELALGEPVNNLAILTPVVYENQRIGLFLVAYRTDYFLKTMSGHKQVSNANAFLYCTTHHLAVVSKQEFAEVPRELQEIALESETGDLISRIDGELSLLSFRQFRKAPWVFASSLPVREVISLSSNYILVSVPILLLVIVLILFLSGVESKKIVRPLNQLLSAVQHFFLTGAEELSSLSLDPKTEIGYLADQFVGMSHEISQVQGNLRESNYLYSALLVATYEMRVVVNLQNGTLQSPADLTKELERFDGTSPRDRLMQFMLGEETGYPFDNVRQLKDILHGNLREPIEIEICCRMQQETDERWYRVIAVPILDVVEHNGRVVLHFEDITHKKQQEFRLIRSAQTDPLCGLLNKSAFLSLCQIGTPVSIAAMFFIDLDQFKQVNDLLGHSAGDEVLVATAQGIQVQFRNTDLIGRYGGDEFVVYAPNLMKDKAREKAKQLVDSLSFSFGEGDHPLRVTASVGVFMLYGKADFPHAIRQADEAMYRAKQNGKSQYCFAEE